MGPDHCRVCGTPGQGAGGSCARCGASWSRAAAPDGPATSTDWPLRPLEERCPLEREWRRALREWQEAEERATRERERVQGRSAGRLRQQARMGEISRRVRAVNEAKVSLVAKRREALHLDRRLLDIVASGRGIDKSVQVREIVEDFLRRHRQIEELGAQVAVLTQKGEPSRRNR